MMKIIACEIFKPYIELLDMELDIVYLDIEGHNYPTRLARMIQTEIDHSLNYNKIIVLYGLCGNAILKLKARSTPIYVVRVHDCLSILLGSQKRFYKLFGNRLSSGWSCYSLENKNKIIVFDEYDEEERMYLEAILNPKKDIYITFSLPNEKVYEQKYPEVIKGDLSFLKMILLLESKDLLMVNENEVLKFDEDKIIVKEEVVWEN